METIQHVVKDQASWWSPAEPSEEAVTDLLESRGVNFTDLAGWQRLDAEEIKRGEERGRERLKITPRDEMLTVSNG